MKVIVKNSELDDYNKEFKVKRINYDKVLVIYPNKERLKEFYNIDVEIIEESTIDNFLINNMEFLKIKLQRGISVAFYKALADGIQLEFKEAVKSIDLLVDNYSINNRNIFEKELLLMINKKYLLKIISTGKKFSRKEYKFNIVKVEKDEFMGIYNAERVRIIKEIEKKEKLLSKYEEVRVNIENTSLCSNLIV
ncbi:MAG: hypothetical protein ACRCVJ_16715 [Clostridium sp.]|uniref:hypothetical protein n=1 Tax=Clostridium sp. TaxID=1506 RepID=UPI003F3039AE